MSSTMKGASDEILEESCSLILREIQLKSLLYPDDLAILVRQNVCDYLMDDPRINFTCNMRVRDLYSLSMKTKNNGGKEIPLTSQFSSVDFSPTWEIAITFDSPSHA